ncbi:MAG: hypothetical protein ABI151_05645 [Chitinophagaceae bacterium]
MSKIKLLLVIGASLLITNELPAQGLLNRIKQKASQVADKVADKKIDEALGGSGSGNNSNKQGTGSTSSGSRKSNPSNTSGQGLVSTPPNVNENLSAAETAFKAGSYGDARYAVQQAMLGVELQIGQSILKSFPETIANLKKDTIEDQVTSTGWGWAGLTIHREYKTGDKQFTITVANNAIWMQALNMFFNNSGYAQQNNGEQKWKQIKVKGNRSVIEYDKSSGYKISIPLGQTSLAILEGVNFATEQDMINAANQLDLDAVKEKLGEK